MLNESILDTPQKDLCPLVWTKTADGQYFLNPALRRKIVSLCQFVFSPKSIAWMNKKANRNWKVEDYQVHIIGSITSNTYGDGSDIDIHFIIPTIPEKDADLFSKTLRANYKNNYLPKNPTLCYGGSGKNKFPFELYYQPNTYMDMASIGCYSVLDGVWEVGPALVDKDFNPYTAYFKKSISHMEDVLPDVRNIILEPYEMSKILCHVKKDESSYQYLAKKIVALLKKSYDISRVVWGKRNYKLAYSKKAAEKLRFDKTRKIVDAAFKFLEKFGYISILRDYAQLWEKFRDGKISAGSLKDAILKSVDSFIKVDDMCIKESKQIRTKIMKKLNEAETIDEAGLIINKNDGAYPKHGQILIMAGGGGSGKSFILDKLILFEGKVFNIDSAKELLILYGKKKPDGTLAQKFKEQYGYELKDISLKNSQQCNDIHEFVTQYNLAFAPQAMFFKAAQVHKEKPNAIFDMTLSQIDRLQYIAAYAELGGYDPKNVHVVWVLNDIKVALAQNATRDRTEPTDVIVKAHNGVVKSMDALFRYSDKWKSVIDGDIWIVFNKKNVDVKSTINLHRNDRGEQRVTMTIDDYVAIHMKERGKQAKTFDSIKSKLFAKILEYVPDESKEYLKSKRKNV